MDNKNIFLSGLTQFVKWLIPSVIVGAILATSVILITNLCFPYQAKEWGLPFLELWLFFGILIGLPIHRKNLFNNDFSPFFNVSVFAISEMFTALFIVLLGLAVTFFFSKETHSFIISNLAVVYLGTVLYSVAITLSDYLWQWLRSKI